MKSDEQFFLNSDSHVKSNHLKCFVKKGVFKNSLKCMISADLLIFNFILNISIYSGTYLKPSWKSMMNFFAKIVIGFYSITIFAKIPIIDIHQSSKCVSAFSLRLFKHLILLKYYTSFKWKILKCKPACPRVQVCQPTSCESASLRVARLWACELQSVSLWAANMWVTSRMHYELWAATRPVCELQAISHVSQ